VQQVRALQAQIREAKRREEILETDIAQAINQARAVLPPVDAGVSYGDDA